VVQQPAFVVTLRSQRGHFLDDVEAVATATSHPSSAGCLLRLPAHARDCSNGDLWTRHNATAVEMELGLPAFCRAFRTRGISAAIMQRTVSAEWYILETALSSAQMSHNIEYSTLHLPFFVPLVFSAVGRLLCLKVF
jgi:hypothetical protein